MGYGKLTFQIERILKKRNISKNQICKDLDIPRSNFVFGKIEIEQKGAKM